MYMLAIINQSNNRIPYEIEGFFVTVLIVSTEKQVKLRFLHDLTHIIHDEIDM